MLPPGMATAPPSNIAEEPVALGPPALKWAFLGYSAPIPHSFLQVVYYIYIYMYTTETFQLTQGLPALAPLQSGPTTVWGLVGGQLTLGRYRFV
jgi:hypothetical protein